MSLSRKGKREIEENLISYKAFKGQKDFLRRVSVFCNIYRSYGLNHQEFLRFVLRELGYMLNITRTGRMNLKRMWSK